MVSPGELDQIPKAPQAVTAASRSIRCSRRLFRFDALGVTPSRAMINDLNRYPHVLPLVILQHFLSGSTTTFTTSGSIAMRAHCILSGQTKKSLGIALKMCFSHRVLSHALLMGGQAQGCFGRDRHTLGYPSQAWSSTGELILRSEPQNVFLDNDV
jgi:hypothetical protein